MWVLAYTRADVEDRWFLALRSLVSAPAPLPVATDAWRWGIGASSRAPPGADDRGGASVPEVGKPRRGGTQVLLSRRQILTGTSYGIGATLLFHHVTRSRVDTVAGPSRLPHPVPVHPARERTDPIPAADGGTPGPAAPSAEQPGAEQAITGRAIHRAQLADGGRPRSVCKGDGGVLVVGVSSDGEPLGWLTEDGTQWLEHTLATPERLVTEVWGVTAYDGHFLAVGATTERDVRRIAESGIVPGRGTQVTYTERRRSPSVWWTTDCAKWSGQTLDEVVGPHAHLIAIDSHDDRIVAVGGTLDDDAVQGNAGLILVSTDGASWRPADLGGHGGLPEGSFTGVAAGPDGRWYATSVDIAGGAVWASDDARRWSVIPGTRRVFRGIALQGIGVDDRRLLVAGTSLMDPQPRYYVSRNGGRRWRTAKLDVSMLAGPDAVVGDLSVISGDVVVVGTHRNAPVLEGGQLYAAH